MLITLLKKYGKIKFSFSISIFVSAFTGSIALILLLIFQGYIDLLGAFLSFGLPMVFTPIIVLKFSTLVLMLEDAKSKLEEKNIELTRAHREVKTLSGLLPICASCKKIRDDKGYWNQLEAYIQNHSEATFSHGLCESCSEKLYGDEEWYHETEIPDE